MGRGFLYTGLIDQIKVGVVEFGSHSAPTGQGRRLLPRSDGEYPGDEGLAKGGRPRAHTGARKRVDAFDLSMNRAPSNNPCPWPSASSRRRPAPDEHAGRHRPGPRRRHLGHRLLPPQQRPEALRCLPPHVEERIVQGIGYGNNFNDCPLHMSFRAQRGIFFLDLHAIRSISIVALGVTRKNQPPRSVSSFSTMCKLWVTMFQFAGIASRVNTPSAA
jgi:hypothetical protein